MSHRGPGSRVPAVLRMNKSFGDRRLGGAASRAKIPVMAGDFPVKKHIFHFGPRANIVHDHVTAGEYGFPVHHHANVRKTAAQVPRHQVAGSVILGAICDRQALAFAAEEHHQIGPAAMVDIRVRLAASPFSGIDAEIRRHVFMHFFLQIDSHSPVGADHLVRANAGISRHVSAGIRKANISWIIANNVLRAVKRRSGKPVQESLPRLVRPWRWPQLRHNHTSGNHGEQDQSTAFIPATLHSQGLTPDYLPEFPESTCYAATATLPAPGTAAKPPAPTTWPVRGSFLPSPTGTASWK